MDRCVRGKKAVGGGRTAAHRARAPDLHAVVPRQPATPVTGGRKRKTANDDGCSAPACTNPGCRVIKLQLEKHKSREKFLRESLEKLRACHLRQDMLFTCWFCPNPECRADLTSMWQDFEAFLLGVDLRGPAHVSARAFTSGSPFYLLHHNSEIKKLLWQTEDKLRVLASLAITLSGMGRRNPRKFIDLLGQVLGQDVPQPLLKSVLFIHADAFHDPPPKEYLARVYRAIVPFLPKECNDIHMDTLLFKHFVIYGDKFPVEDGGILSSMLAPTPDDNEVVPYIVSIMRQQMANLLERRTRLVRWIIPAFLEKLSACLAGITIGTTPPATVTERIMAAQRICYDLFDMCGSLDGLEMIPVCSFTFKRFVQIAKQCAEEFPQIANISDIEIQAYQAQPLPMLTVSGYNDANPNLPTSSNQMANAYMHHHFEPAHTAYMQLTMPPSSLQPSEPPSLQPYEAHPVPSAVGPSVRCQNPGWPHHAQSYSSLGQWNGMRTALPNESSEEQMPEESEAYFRQPSNSLQ